MVELFNEASVPYNLRQDVSFCHASHLKFGISEIARQTKFFAKRLKMETR